LRELEYLLISFSIIIESKTVNFAQFAKIFSKKKSRVGQRFSQN